MYVKHKRILEPSIGDIVYQRMPRGNYVKVQILGGQLFDTKYGRLSNFWKWKVIETEEIQEDYGNFYDIIISDEHCEEVNEAIEEIKANYRVLTNILINTETDIVIIKITRQLIKELRGICKLAYYQLTGEDLKEIIIKEDQNNDN